MSLFKKLTDLFAPPLVTLSLPAPTPKPPSQFTPEQKKRWLEIIRRSAPPRPESPSEKAARIEREEVEKRTIGCDIPPVRMEDFLAGKGRWSPLGMLAHEKAEAEKREKWEGEQLVEIAEATFDPDSDGFGWRKP